MPYFSFFTSGKATLRRGRHVAALLLVTAGAAQAQTATFAPVVPYSTGTNSSPYSIAVADVNGDGKPDLLKANGETLRAIADQLNQSGYCTRRGKAFHPMGVQRLLAKRP